jgi:hypothetical protein
MLFGPPLLRQLAKDFSERCSSLPSQQDLDAVEVNPEKFKRIADEFEAAVHHPDHQETRRSYEALCDETKCQFEFLREAGLVIQPWKGPGQPYAGSSEMLASLRAGHLYFFLTSRGHGPHNCQQDGQLDQGTNPFLSPSGITIDGEPLVYNDLFRAVHDCWGHGIGAFNFGPNGEERAWMAHSHLFSDLARRALTTETRAQAAWQNFGPHMRDFTGRLLKKGDKGYLPIAERPYAAQKMTLLPKWVSEVTHNS